MKLYQIMYKGGTSGDGVYSNYKQAEKEIMNRGYTNVRVSIRESRNYMPVIKRYYTDTGDDDYMYIEETSLSGFRILGSISSLGNKKYNEEDNIRYFTDYALKMLPENRKDSLDR